MEKLLRDFLETVKRENQILNNLAELGQEKQQLIIGNKVKELDSLIQKEGIVVSNLTKLEGARFKLQDSIAAKWEMKAEELSAGRILINIREYFPEMYKDFEEEIRQLGYNLTRLNVINKHNNELIEQSLDYIDLMQSMFNGDTAGTYSNSKTQNDENSARPRVNIVDKKV